MADLDWLPVLVEVDWNRFAESVDRAYAVFLADFGHASRRPLFQNRRLGLKHHPEIEGKSATFWHFVTEGSDESKRTPDRERLERIGWPGAMVVEAGRQPPRVRVWSTRRGSAVRWVIALEDFSYVVILDDRGEFLLPWTAFPVVQEHRRTKLRKEYDAWRAGQKS